jgi:ppGpp synthetase/RelA/SpoT-type nucleotidyltranferase
VDDIAILTYGKTLSEAEAYTNSDVTVMEKRAQENKMKFNESKVQGPVNIKEKETRKGYNIPQQ